MQIKELEIEVGLPLFDRSSRKVSLTMVGEYVLAHTRRVLAAMRDAEDMVARFRGLQTGVLDVGMVSTAKYFLPRLLAQFRDEHPGIEIRLQVSNNREQVVALMQQGSVELAIMGRPPEGLADARRALRHASARAGHLDRAPVRAHGERARDALLADEGFIVREPGSGTRAALDEFMEAHQMSPRVVMQMSSNEAIKQAVMAGMGVALLSLHTVGTGTRSSPDRRPGMPRGCRSCAAGTWSTTWPRRSRPRPRRSATSFWSAAKRSWPSISHTTRASCPGADTRCARLSGLDQAVTHGDQGQFGLIPRPPASA